MGKATANYHRMVELAKTLPEQTSSLPELRLRADSVVDIDHSSVLWREIQRLHASEVRNVLVRDESTGVEAVVVPVERYVSLVGLELQQDRKVGLPDGRLEPSGLPTAEVVQVDLNAAWFQAPRATA